RCDRRMQTPNGWFGEMRFLTCGRDRVSESHNCGQSSSGCTSVEYVRWPRPRPKSIRLHSRHDDQRGAAKIAELFVDHEFCGLCGSALIVVVIESAESVP